MAITLENLVMRESHHPQYGEWRREKELGSGAFGTVYMWRNAKTKEEIAIKKCKIMNSQAMLRWQTEMKMIEDMHHPNIVSFVKIPEVLIAEYPGRCSLGMEYCSLGDLRKFLGKTENVCGVAECHAIDITGDIGHAIKYLHDKNNMHRDLKPENIVMRPRPDCEGRFQFKITDLGYAKDLDLASCGHSFVGTLAYLAPEVAIGNNMPTNCLRYYSSVDYWSFGLVVFECITGHRPFLANMPPINALNAIKCKKDDDIFAWLDTRSKDPVPRFSKEIPSPHQLNPHLARKMTEWLRLMLCFEQNKRGDGDNWYKLLVEEILCQKYAKVLNVQNMKLMTFPLDESAFGRAVQLKIHTATEIADTDQLLLLREGNVPNATLRFIEQLEFNTTYPNEAVIYLFDKSEKDWHAYKCETPPGIAPYLKTPSNVNQPTRDDKRLMFTVLHDTLTNVKTGLFFHGALSALLARVETVSKNLQEKLREFTFTNQKTIGMVELFNVSLEKDVAENSAQDNSSGICADEAFREECRMMEGEVREWKAELNKGESLIKDAKEQLLLPKRYFSESTELDSLRDNMIDMRKKSIEFCYSFRMACRKFEHQLRAPPVPKDTDKKYEQFRQNQLRQFVNDYWRAVVKTLEKALDPKSHLRKMTRFYINHHIKLETIYYEMVRQSHQYCCIANDLKERQMNRQRSVWIMLQYMKDVYNLAFAYEKDANAPNDLEERANGLQDCMTIMMRDEDIRAFLRLADDANQQPQVQPTAVNAYHAHGPAPVAVVPNSVSSDGVTIPHNLAATQSPSGVSATRHAARGSADPSMLRFSELEISPIVSSPSDTKTNQH